MFETYPGWPYTEQFLGNNLKRGRRSLFSPSVLHGEDLSNADENVYRVSVDAQWTVDGVILSGAIHRMWLSSFDDFLSVVQEEAAEQNETTVESKRIDSSTKSRSLKNNEI